MAGNEGPDPKTTGGGQSSSFASLPEAVWSPLVTAVLVLIPGLLSLASGYPLLFASLGPSSHLHASQPHLPSAHFYNTVMGHLIALGAAFLALWVWQADAEPSLFLAHQLSPGRLGACVLGAFVLVLLQWLLRASHPPATATMLLVTLGGFHILWKDALAIILGVLIIAVTGELPRRLRLGRLRADRQREE